MRVHQEAPITPVTAEKEVAMNPRHRLIVAAVMLASALSAGVAMLHAAQQQEAPAKQEAPQMPPAPGEHHKWLQQLVGTWTVESEMSPPGAPAMKATGTDTVRSIGGRWIVSELKSDVPGMGLMHAVSVLGYNPQKGKYQGTWVDSILDHIWVYDGTLDPTGKILTLEAEGPNMMDPAGGPGRYRDVIEIKDDDYRTLSSYGFADGKWVHFATAHYRRAK